MTSPVSLGASLPFWGLLLSSVTGESAHLQRLALPPVGCVLTVQGARLQAFFSISKGSQSSAGKEDIPQDLKEWVSNGDASEFGLLVQG